MRHGAKLPRKPRKGFAQTGNTLGRLCNLTLEVTRVNEAQRSERRIDRLVMPRAGEQWHLKRSPERVATVLYFDDASDPEWPSMPLGYVRIRAPWYRGGEGGKALDMFFKQFDRHNA